MNAHEIAYDHYEMRYKLLVLAKDILNRKTDHEDSSPPSAEQIMEEANKLQQFLKDNPKYEDS